MESVDEYRYLAVREPRYIAGAGAPLFDRLADSGDGREAYSSRILDLSAVYESVLKALSGILNTRAPFFGPVPEMAGDTVLNYGVPDFAARAPGSESGAAEFSAIIAEQILRFEPRLSGVRVVLAKNPERHNAFIGSISAQLNVGSVREPVSFPLLFDAGTDSVEVIESTAAIARR